MRAQREQQFCALCHLCNAVPLWGLLFCGWIWFSLREESREVVYHARQAMTFHVLLMLGLVIYIALGFLTRLVAVLSPAAGRVLAPVNDLIPGVLFVAYAATCLYGAVRCWRGQPFHYPLLGPRAAS